MLMMRQHNGVTAEWRNRKEELERLYHQPGMSQDKLAKQLGCTQALLSRLLIELAIAPKSRGRRGVEHHEYIHGKSTVLYRGLVVKTWCERCMRTDHLCIHHRNMNHYDNTPENLAVYCQGCHQSEHKKAWWTAKKRGLPLPKSNGLIGWKRGNNQHGTP